MIEQQVSLTKVGTVAGWVLVVALLVAAWVVGVLADSEKHYMVAALLAGSGCALSALAATLNIRCYVLKLARLITAMAPESSSAANRMRVTR